ncbi:MAG: hypothetical protein ACW98K_13200 [Candidatus Kariarchaeaceae archaeon]
MNLNKTPKPLRDPPISSETLRKKYLRELGHEDPSLDKAILYFNFETDQELKTMFENILVLSDLALETKESYDKDVYIKKIKELIKRKGFQIDL